jgi:predicted lysophospholipase L1 biosynthesis ABC-type transport system permease subunit
VSPRARAALIAVVGALALAAASYFGLSEQQARMVEGIAAQTAEELLPPADTDTDLSP